MSSVYLAWSTVGPCSYMVRFKFSFSPLVKVLAKSALQVKGLGIGLSIWFKG